MMQETPEYEEEFENPLWEENNRLPPEELLQDCILPVGQQMIIQALPLLLLSLIFHIFCCLIPIQKTPRSSRIRQSFLHLVSTFFGVVALIYNIGNDAWLYFILVVASYPLLRISGGIKGSRPSSTVILLFCLAAQLSCEFFMKAEKWHKIRGVAMVLAMKIISLGYDLESGLLPAIPDPLEYSGYLFNCATLIFGPWISYHDYAATVANDAVVSLTFGWCARLAIQLLCGLFCLLHSTCFATWIIPDGSHKWLLAYRDAQSFRFSHYFVCSLSEALSTAAGLQRNMKDTTRVPITVTKPVSIELPRSLVDVVVGWNLPMHVWLKEYIFTPSRKYGAFFAVMATYLASALLHGLNFQLAAVLLSLGFYTYTEHVLRRGLATTFSACIEARKCRQPCTHRYKNTMIIYIINSLFALLAIFHLAYLGVMFDSAPQQVTGYSMWHTLSKWKNLDYLSHIIAVSTFAFYWLIK